LFYHDIASIGCLLLKHALASYSECMYDYEITAPAAALLLKEGKAKLIDVREPWEFATAKVEDSTLMPMGEVPARAHQELDPDDRLFILCHHGARSLSVTNWLRQQGFEGAQSVAGGIDAWSQSVDAAVPRY
jgi:rhodanese-related sulfurtransferase